MKKRDIILDFTSLLDVTLIIIFFFVLFSNLDSQENKIRTDTRVKELEFALQEAENREEAARLLEEKLKKEIAIVKEYSGRQASNVSEIIQFNRSENIKFLLDMKADDWSIKVVRGPRVISSLAGDDNIGPSIVRELQAVGYDGSDTLFCDFIFDGSLPGTASAYKKIKKGLEDVTEEYKYFYLSETDLSIGG